MIHKWATQIQPLINCQKAARTSRLHHTSKSWLSVSGFEWKLFNSTNTDLKRQNDTSSPKLGGYRSLISHRGCTLSLFHSSTRKQALEMIFFAVLHCFFTSPPADARDHRVSSTVFRFYFILTNTSLPTEKKHLEGKVPSPPMVNMGIAARTAKTNVIHHID